MQCYILRHQEISVRRISVKRELQLFMKAYRSQNIAVRIIAYDEEQMTVTYQTSFDTVAGTISFENKALFLKDEEGYQLVWDDSLIFPNLALQIK